MDYSLGSVGVCAWVCVSVCSSRGSSIWSGGNRWKGLKRPHPHLQSQSFRSCWLRPGIHRNLFQQQRFCSHAAVMQLCGSSEAFGDWPDFNQWPVFLIDIETTNITMHVCSRPRRVRGPNREWCGVTKGILCSNVIICNTIQKLLLFFEVFFYDYSNVVGKKNVMGPMTLFLNW